MQRSRMRTRWVLLIIAGVALALAFAGRAMLDRVPGGPGDELAAIESLMAIAPVHLRSSLSDIELLDIEVRANSSAKVQYVHDHLYDVVFIYRRGGETRTITAPYGLNAGAWITPTKVEILARDESALVVSR